MFQKLLEKFFNNKNSPLIGKIGITESDLQPTGIATIDNDIYEVTTEGEFVETGRGVKVTRVKGKKIIVKRV